MQYTNFQIGEKFPLPIKARGDGGIFQYDSNGAMFILKLSRADVIAQEAFRTGKIELGLFIADDLLFLLYNIDGITGGWGDCPYALQTLTPAQRPNLTAPCEQTLHLYLVDSRLDILLSMRTAALSDAFWQTLLTAARAQQCKEFYAKNYAANVRAVWANYTSEEMLQKASARMEIPFKIPAAENIFP